AAFFDQKAAPKNFSYFLSMICFGIVAKAWLAKIARTVAMCQCGRHQRNAHGPQALPMAGV
ncbi:hypothetical protein, partial [Novacetimonas hansenii]|uniref:hypothetical protein n=1 Tax=Novacetimonas hansenii TaxID=436 RepID=UPI000662ACA9